MDGQYEQCRKNLELLVDWYRKNEGDRNEATTRLHLINTLFLDCLGWTKNDVKAEEQEGGERTDYEFSAPRRILIVEAKREGKYFELPVGTSEKIEFSIPSLCRDYSDLKEALEQVAQYCQHRGAPFGSVCNGHQIVAFISSRQDGKSPLEGRALVFDSLDRMLECFFDLWKVLSKKGVEEKNLRVRLIADETIHIPPKLSSTISNYPGVKRRNIFQADLKILSDLVLEDVAKAPELEERFLKDCYCQSGALSQNSMLAKEILKARYAELFGRATEQPALVSATSKKGVNLDLLSDSISRRPILLLGDVGVGKSIFMRNLIKIEAADLLQKHIVLTIDLGSQAALAMDLREAIFNIIERKLREDYRIDIQEGKFVRNVYRKEIQRFKKSIYEELAKTNPNAFKEKEVGFLEKKIALRDQHIKSSIESVTKERGLQVLLILDNVDQRTKERDQETVFLIAQEIAENWPTMVFVALRPETFYKSLRLGSVSGYHPKAFTISPPRIDRVMEKRLKFACLVTTGTIPVQRLKTTSIKLEALTVIIRSFLESLTWRDELVTFIDNIAGGNVRIALDLVREFFGSGHIDTRKIVDKYKETGSYYIRLFEFLRSVIYGDYEHYDPTKSCIANIFDIRSLDPKEHFLVSIMIKFVTNEGRNRGEHGFVDISRVYERLQGLGFTADQIDEAIVRSSRSKLIELSPQMVPYKAEEPANLVRATSIGIYHVEELSSMFSYIDAIAVDTPVLDKKTRQEINDVEEIAERVDRAELLCEYLNNQWIELEGKDIGYDWMRVSKKLKDDILAVRKRINNHK